jgi:hypothetical protein
LETGSGGESGPNGDKPWGKRRGDRVKVKRLFYVGVLLVALGRRGGRNFFAWMPCDAYHTLAITVQ